MTELLDLRKLLQETTATLEQMEREVARAPQDWGLATTAESLRRRQSELEEAFVAVANSDWQDVCNYRIIPPHNSDYPIMAIAKSLQSFQDLVTTIFDAFKTRPKTRARISAEIAAASTLSFGYSYPGSLGFVFTMANERVLIGESELDKTISAIFEMAKAENPRQLADFVARVGVAGIRSLYAWSRVHHEYGLSVDILWRNQGTVQSRVLMQNQELRHLNEIIEQASDETIEQLTLDGLLVGGDLQTRRFHMSFPDADDVVGQIGEDFSPAPEALVLGRRYRATVVKRTLTKLSTGDEDTHWTLIGLTPI
jgi:hypothetical protein